MPEAPNRPGVARPPTHRGSSWATFAIVVVSVVAKVLTLWISPGGGANEAGSAGTTLGPLLDIGLFTAVQVLYLALTVLLITRVPSNAISWLVACIVVSGALGGLSEAVVAGPWAQTHGWWWKVAAWIDTWYWAAFIGSFLLLFHLFPTGRPIGGRLRWGTRAAFVATGLAVVGLMTSRSNPPSPPNPLALSVPTIVQTVGSAVLALSWAMALLTIVPILVTRFRRSLGNERQQLKWFLFCVVAALGCFLLQGIADWLIFPAVALPALGVGVALLRYRLYDLDRVISRTTSYAVVTGLLVVTFAIVVTLLSALLPKSGSLAVAAATLAAAALARPVLGRVQAVVDRRFNRSRYDALRTADEFSAQLRHRIGTDQVRADLLIAVRATLQPETIGLWLKDAK